MSKNWVDEILDNAVQTRRSWPEWMQRMNRKTAKERELERQQAIYPDEIIIKLTPSNQKPPSCYWCQKRLDVLQRMYCSAKCKMRWTRWLEKTPEEREKAREKPAPNVDDQSEPCPVTGSES
jgi:hypothetical protein